MNKILKIFDILSALACGLVVGALTFETIPEAYFLITIWGSKLSLMNWLEFGFIGIIDLLIGYAAIRLFTK